MVYVLVLSRGCAVGFERHELDELDTDHVRPICTIPRACSTSAGARHRGDWRENAYLVQSNGNGTVEPTNLKIVPCLLSFGAVAFVLLAVVDADAQPPATSSLVIPPIPPGQARIWVYRGSQPTSPLTIPMWRR